MNHLAHPDKKILVVDNDPMALLLLQDILTTAGYHNQKATTDASLGWEVFHIFNPDLVLLNIEKQNDRTKENNEECKGYTLLKRFKKEFSANDYRPIIALLNDANADFKRRVLQDGANDFLIKPFDHTEVLLRINNLLHTRQMFLQQKHLEAVATSRE